MVLLLLGVATSACGGGGGASAGSGDGLDPLREGDEATVRGVVVENTIDPCLFPDDTPCVEGVGHVLRLDTDVGPVGVHYAGHHGEPCPNPEANDQAGAARVGQTVEVFALVQHAGPDGLTMSVCESAAYRVAADP